MIRRNLSGIPTFNGGGICLLRYPGLAAGYSESTDTRVPPLPPPLSPFLSHNDIGFNYVERGEFRVLLSTGYRYTHRAGQLSVYWGAIPHRVEAVSAAPNFYWLALPLGIFLRWSVARTMTESLVRGRVFLDDDEEGRPDLLRMKRWRTDLESGGPEAGPIVLLELEARLRRMASTQSGSAWTPERLSPGGTDRQAERMLLLIAERFRDAELSTASVAKAIDLHPDYAGRVFRRSIGISINEYITECRIAHAKAMLATGDAGLLEVMMDSGFGSVSQFHEVFKRSCGLTPGVFRNQVRHPPDMG